jgi:hypothetical protein
MTIFESRRIQRMAGATFVQVGSYLAAWKNWRVRVTEAIKAVAALKSHKSLLKLGRTPP